MDNMNMPAAKPKTGVIVTAVLASAVIFGGLGYYIGSMYETAPAGTVTYTSPTASTSAKASAATSTTASASATSTDTSTWKSETYNAITFKHPTTWTWTSADGELMTDVTKKSTEVDGATDTLGIVITKRALGGKTLEAAVTAYAAAGEGYKLTNKQDISVAGTTGLRYDKSTGASFEDSVFFVSGTDYYEVSASVGPVALTQTDLKAFKPTFDTFLATITK
jgi:hypothetical protein